MRKIVHEVRKVFDRATLNTLIFFVTSACNFKCPFCCYADNLNQRGDLKLDEIEKIARTAGPFRTLLVSGGEPFLRKDLAQVLAAFRTHCGIQSVDIPTNGWFLDKIAKTSEDFLASYPGVQLTVSMSMDGVGEINDRVRGMPGAFEKSLKTLEGLAELRKRHENFRVKIGSVVTRGNGASVDELIDFIRGRFPWVDDHTVEVERDLDLARTDYASKQELTADYARLVAKTLAIYGTAGHRHRRSKGVPPFVSRMVYEGVWEVTTRTKIDRIMGKRWPFPCTAGRTIVVINNKGELSPCELRGEKVKLAEFDFDMRRALASPAFQAALQAIEKERCDCTHGCFVENSLRHSGPYFMANVPLSGLMRKARAS